MPRSGDTNSRGYGAVHKRIRAVLLPLSYGKPCPRCGEPMLPGQQLDLGHNDDRSGYNGMEHASCNRRAGAINRNKGHVSSHRRNRKPPSRVFVDTDDL